MKKLVIVSMVNLYLSPYIKKYIEKGLRQHYQIDVVFWNRHGVDESNYAPSEQVKLMPYSLAMPDDQSKLTKVQGYVRFARYVNKVLKESHYDRVIFLQTVAAILQTWILRRRYAYRYLVDIRDYTMEENGLFKLVERQLLAKSRLNVISSAGYKVFLPKEDYVVTHNFTPVKVDKKRGSPLKIPTADQPLKVAYIGLVRFDDKIKWFIDRIKDNDQIEFQIIGEGAERFTEYIQDNHIRNVKLRAYFDPVESEELFADADVIYNLYGQGTPLLDYALSNKLYYAAQLKKPILVFENTYMAVMAQKYSFDITVPVDMLANSGHDLANFILTQYVSINQNDLVNGTNEFVNHVITDIEIYDQRIDDFLIS